MLNFNYITVKISVLPSRRRKKQNQYDLSLTEEVLLCHSEESSKHFVLTAEESPAEVLRCKLRSFTSFRMT